MKGKKAGSKKHHLSVLSIIDTIHPLNAFDIRSNNKKEETSQV